MKKIVLTMLLSFILTASAYAGVYVEGNLLIHTSEALYVTEREPELQTNKDWFNALISTYNISDLRQLGENNIPPDMDYFYYLVVFDTTFTVEEVQTEFSTKDEVIFAEPNSLLDLYSGVNTNDTHADSLWGLEKIGMNEVWSEIGEYGNPDVILAVHDTGIDLGLNPGDPIHEDLYGNLWQDSLGYYGYNFYAPHSEHDEDSLIPQDLFGHGTHVSGTIAAMTNNGVGVAGIVGGWGEENPGCKIMTIRAGDAPGLPISCCVNGLWYAHNNGADVVNMSWGGSSSSPSLQLCIDSISSTKPAPLLIAASGNNDTEASHYPASYPQVIAVAATDINDEKCGFSNYGNWVDISAPGGRGSDPSTTKIFSTMPFDDEFYMHVHFGYQPEYDYMQGTSMASPHVVGLAGLIKSHFPELTNQQIRGRILGTADDIYPENLEYGGKLGAGRINAYRALTEDEHPTLRFQKVVIDDSNNGVFEYGETATITIGLKNWWIEAENVQGTLQTDDPSITIEDSIGLWGNIGQEEIALNEDNAFVITDDSVNPRLAVFTLYLEADNMEPQNIQFSVEVHPNISIPLVTLPLTAEETITTEAVISDIDNDEVDEIIVGSSSGNVFIVDYPDIITFDTGAPINSTPAAGDIDNDGYEEIVAGSDDGKVWILDYQSNVQFTTQLNGKITNNIVIEDVTGDQQLEIILTTAEVDGFGINGWHIINPISQEVFSFSENGEIKAGVAVGDVNGNISKEVVLCSGSHPAYLRVYSVDSEFSATLLNEYQFGAQFEWDGTDYLNPVIADINEDGCSEILVGYRLIPGNIPKEAGPRMFVYNCMLSDTLWTYPAPSSFIWPPHSLSTLIAGDIQLDDGLEIIFVSHLLDCEGNFLKTCYPDDAIIEPIIGDISGDQEQEIAYFSGAYKIVKVLTNNLDEIPEWRMYSSPTDKFQSLALGSITSNLEHDINIVSENGHIYSVPTVYSPTSISEWPQYQNNARNTGSYFQPLPEVISHDITVKHNTVIDKNIEFSPLATPYPTLTFEPGTEILFKPLGSISGGNILAVGTEEDPIIFAGLCADTTKAYWQGISMKRNSESHFKQCYLQNAVSAIFMEDVMDQHIENCHIENNTTGICLYSSSPIIKENIITGNDVGIAGFHKSMPILSALDSPKCRFKNAIVNNNVRDIFLDSSIPYLSNGFNDIYNTFGGCYIELENYPDKFLKASRNYWGSTNIEEIYTHLDPADLFVIEPICEEPNTPYNPYITPEFDLLSEGYTYLGNEDYVNAELTFKNLIETYPETQEADQSISGLFICYKESEGDWDEFETYINGLLNQPDISETTQKLLFNYLCLCKREKEEYDIAIANYESILENDPSYEDSCYAVIDIGNTYLETEYGGKGIPGKYPELVPVSAELHQQKTRELLNSILTGKHIYSPGSDISKLILYQNYPNPCTHNTTISYAIPKAGNVSLKVYNIKGQLVKTIVDEHKEEGHYAAIWDGKDNNGKPVSSGIYFYKLDTDNSQSQIRKMLLIR